MDDSDKNNSISELENKVKYLESKVNELEDNNPDSDEQSLISYLLDTFNFKGLITFIANSQNQIYLSNNFINASLLLVFLLFVLFVPSALIFTIIAIGLLVLGEVLKSNSNPVIEAFSSEKRTKKLLDEIKFKSQDEVIRGIRSQKFSTKNMHYFIDLLKENIHNYPLYVIDYVIDYQFIDKNNLDKLLDYNLLKYLHYFTIYKLLFKKMDCLTVDNIKHIYDSFKDNDNVLKMLIATQSYSVALKNYYDDVKISKYYNLYWIEERHISLRLKYYEFLKSTSKLVGILVSVFVSVYSFSYSTSVFDPTSPEIIPLVFAPVFSGLVTFGFFRIISDHYYDKYFQQFVHNVINTDENINAIRNC